MAFIKNSLQQNAYKLVFWQFIVIAGLALILLLLQGMKSSLSALLGGMAYVLPNFMFVWRVYARNSVQEAKRFLVAFVVGESSKLFISAALFVLIVKFLPVNLLAVLGGYIAAIFAFWVVSFVVMSHDRPGESQ
jgi:ATP synthase protein I